MNCKLKIKILNKNIMNYLNNNNSKITIINFKMSFYIYNYRDEKFIKTMKCEKINKKT
jgi:hypothetical protein